MLPRGFVLWFRGPASETRTTIGSLTTHELKQRGCNVEILDGQSAATDWMAGLGNAKDDDDAYIRHLQRVSTSVINNEAIALVVVKSDAPRVEALVEVDIGTPKEEEGGDENLNLTKLVLQSSAGPEQSVAEILSKLESLDLIAGQASRDSSSYDEDDEATIRQRLEALGYL